MTTIKKLKVCGMRDAENIRELATLGPDYMGFIFYPGSKRFAETLNRKILSVLSPAIVKTGVFVDADLAEITDKTNTLGLNAIQLHGNESPEFCKAIKGNGLTLIKAFGVDENFYFDSLINYEGLVDYFLFDTKTALHGGSGLCFNWNLLKKYRLNTPYFLSGGLDSQAIEKALELKDTRFYGLDLNSKFETNPGLKDIEKLKPVFKLINHYPAQAEIK